MRIMPFHPLVLPSQLRGIPFLQLQSAEVQVPLLDGLNGVVLWRVHLFQESVCMSSAISFYF